MAILRERPYLTSNFRVAFSDDTDSLASGFCEVIFPDFVVKRPTKTRTPGAPTTSVNLILRRGFQGSLELYEWFDEERRRAAGSKGRQRRDLVVTLLDEDQSGQVLTWRFTRVRPVRLGYSPLQSMASEVLIESIELEFDRMEME